MQPEAEAEFFTSRRGSISIAEDQLGLRACLVEIGTAAAQEMRICDWEWFNGFYPKSSYDFTLKSLDVVDGFLARLHQPVRWKGRKHPKIPERERSGVALAIGFYFAATLQHTASGVWAQVEDDPDSMPDF